MPTLPDAFVKRLRTEVPIVPDGGLAKVHPANIPEKTSIKIKTLLDILISIPRHTTL